MRHVLILLIVTLTLPVAVVAETEACSGLAKAVQDTFHSYSAEARTAIAYKHYCTDKARLLHGKIGNSGVSAFDVFKITGDPEADEKTRESFCKTNLGYEHWKVENATDWVQFNEAAGKLYLECVKLSQEPVAFDVEHLSPMGARITLHARTPDFALFPVVEFESTGGTCQLVEGNGKVHLTAPQGGVPFTAGENLFLKCTHDLTATNTDIIVRTLRGPAYVLNVPRVPKNQIKGQPPVVRITALRLEVNKTCDNGSQAKNADIGWSVVAAGREIAFAVKKTIPPGGIEMLGGNVIADFPKDLSLPLSFTIRDHDRDEVSAGTVKETLKLTDFQGTAHRTWPLSFKSRLCDITLMLAAELLDSAAADSLRRDQPGV